MRYKVLFQTVWVGLGLMALLALYYFSFVSGRSYLWEDLLYYSYPSANFLAQAFHDGRFPLWIGGMHNGLPFYTNLNLTAFYPPVWILALVAPGGKVSVVAYQSYLVLQLVGAGLFAWLFFKDQGLRVGAAIAGMVVFVFSAFMSLQIIHANAITSFLWLPLQCLFVGRIVARRSLPGSIIGLIISTLMSFLAGFPQVVMYNSYFVAAYWLFLALIRRGPPDVSAVRWIMKTVIGEGFKIAGVFLVVILLGAVQFYPVAENWSLSSREHLSYAQITDDSLPWHYLLHGLAPNFFGMSSGSGGGVPFWGFDKNSSGYSIYHACAWHYWEFGFFAGQLAFVAVIVLLFNYRKVWVVCRENLFFIWAIPPILLLMMGCYGGLFKVFYHVVPGFSLFRVPARIGCLLDFCLAVNVAYFVNYFLEKKLTLELRRPFFTVGIIYVIASGAVLVFGSSVFPELQNATLWGHAVKQLFLAVFFCALTMGGVWYLARSRCDPWSSCCALVLVVLAYVELFVAFQPFHGSRVDPDEYYADRSGLISQMARIREASGPFRFAQLRDGALSEELVFPRNIGYLYPAYEALEGFVLFNLKDWGAFNSVTNERVKLDIQNVGVIANLDSRSRRVSLMQYTNSLPRAKFYHHIRAYDDDEAIYTDLNSGRLDYHSELGVLRHEIERYGISTSLAPVKTEAHIRFIPVNPDEYRISYQTTEPGIIFISESYYPGWTADEGRCPVIKVFGAFKGIVIPEAGSREITVRFTPRTFRIGLAISLASILCVIGVWLWLGRSSR